MRNTIHELLKAVFYMRFVARLYSEDKRENRQTPLKITRLHGGAHILLKLYLGCLHHLHSFAVGVEFYHLYHM